MPFETQPAQPPASILQTLRGGELPPALPSLEAVAAVNRAPISWLERDLSFLAAVRADDLVHLARAGSGAGAAVATAAAPTTVAATAVAGGFAVPAGCTATGVSLRFARCPAVRAARGLAESTGGVKLLLASTEHELVAAITALQNLIGTHGVLQN
jgi:hypothetical protein